MKKLGVIFVLLDVNKIKEAFVSLNFNNAEPIAILIDNGGNGKRISINGTEIQIFSFAHIKDILNVGKNLIWLICGYARAVSDIYKVKKFLLSCGVPEDNIVNFELSLHLTSTWVANVRYIEKNPIDYFATGISYYEKGLNLNAFPKILHGINLCGSNQDLRQGYLTARYVFEHVRPRSIKFVLIALTPYSFRYDNIEAFSICPRNLQYIWALQNSKDDSLHGQLLQFLVSDAIKEFTLNVTDKDADLNLDTIKNSMPKEFSAKDLINWEDELKNLTKTLYPKTVKKNLKILEDYIKLCMKNGARPIGIMFPFAPMMHDNYNQELLSSFRHKIKQFQRKYIFEFIDLFDLNLDYSCFYDMAHLNLKGSMIASSVLSTVLHQKGILPFEGLSQMPYSFFDNLSYVLPKEQYNNLMDKLFTLTIEKIRKQKKIKIGFCLDNSAMWCGDELYNYFANNPTYEVTVFLCANTLDKKIQKVMEDFHHGVESFKSRNIKVIGISDNDAVIPKQDILIYLRQPSPNYYPFCLTIDALTPETLMAYIPYGFHVSGWDNYNVPIMHCAWRIFFETEFNLQDHVKKCITGMLRGYYSGYPRLDIFLGKGNALNFDWKMAQPNSKKIIYAPHWSINSGVLYATFQYNYKFMYEYAKAHPEISWVFKPHPHLFRSAIESGLFSSEKAFEDYLNQWDSLPNAKVVTGAYYHSIFATSDGMIQDSGSFIGEYQFTHKPMIFLTRNTQKFNDLFRDLMKVLYLVDGKDFNGISKLISEVFIKGNDELFDDRINFFSKYLDYKKINGMSASEYIFKNINKEIE